MKVGFVFITLMALWSISPMVEWISSMQLPKWITGLLMLIALGIWFCGITFLYHAEKAVFNKKKHE